MGSLCEIVSCFDAPVFAAVHSEEVVALRAFPQNPSFHSVMLCEPTHGMHLKQEGPLALLKMGERRRRGYVVNAFGIAKHLACGSKF